LKARPLHYDIFETQAGWVGAITSAAGVTRATIPQPSPADCADELGPQLDLADHEPDALSGFRDALQGYFLGEVVDFTAIPTDFADAPPFMRSAWRACQSIPRGETRTYKWLAGAAGRPNAPRAAGQAMARNRVPFLVPCHRVIASGGGLGGYGSGKSALALKRWLIDEEASGGKGPPPPHWWRS
jgi:methylated-DNA-[protein]-cysteine S-methyltransferase